MRSVVIALCVAVLLFSPVAVRSILGPCLPDPVGCDAVPFD